MINSLFKAKKIEKIYFFISFFIVSLLQLKSNLLMLYIPLLFCILIFGYFYMDKVVQLIIMFNFSFVFLTLNQIMPLFSGNQIYYLPAILKDKIGLLNFDFNANITYPYPSYKFLVETIIDIFGINILNILDFLALLISFFLLCYVSFLFFKKNYISFTLILLVLLSPGILQFLFVKVLRIDRFFSLFTDGNIFLYKHIILKINDYISSGLAHFTIIPTSFEPSFFGILLLPSIYLFSKEKYLNSFILGSFAVIMHTYNIVPTSILLLAYFLKQKNKVSIIEVSPLIVVFTFVSVYSINNLSSSNEIFVLADNILTNNKMQNHRMFNGQITLFSLATFDLTEFKFRFGGNYPGLGGFPFELELIIFYFIIKKLSDKNTNLYFTITFYAIIASLILSYFNQSNIIGAYIRTFTPWRLSLLIYFFGTLFLFNKLIDLVNRNLLFINLTFITLIFSFVLFEFNNRPSESEYVIYDLESPFWRITNFLPNNQNEDRLRININEVMEPLFEDSGQYLADFEETDLVFNTFTSTSGNINGHPYKPDEIIEWWSKHQDSDNIFDNQKSCEEIIQFAKDNDYEGIIFSKTNRSFQTLKNCGDTEIEENGIYVLKIKHN